MRRGKTFLDPRSVLDGGHVNYVRSTQFLRAVSHWGKAMRLSSLTHKVLKCRFQKDKVTS